MNYKRLIESQPMVFQIINNSIEKNRMSHAYLFYGEKGTNKYQTAKYFAAKILCLASDETPCGECSNCRRINNETHPNLITVLPENRVIKKQQIVDLQHDFQMTAIEDGAKVYIIKNIDLINASAANSLLKFLEEPHDNIYAILTTDNIASCLPTIISRTQTIKFNSLPSTAIYDYLIEESYGEHESKIVSYITSSLQDSIEMINNENFLEIEGIVSSIYQIIDTRKEDLILFFKEHKSLFLHDKELLSIFLDMMILFHKDILNYQTDDNFELVFLGHKNTIVSLSGKKDKNRLIDELELILELKSKVNSYINYDLTLDYLMIKIEGELL